MKRNTLLFMIAIALLTATQIFAQGRGDTKSEILQQPLAKNSDLTGVWITKATPPPEAGSPFPGIFTFTSDGVLTAAQAGGGFPALGNPQLGLWGQAGARQFVITYYGQDFDDKFQLTDTYRCRGTISVNKAGDKFTGLIDITVYDLDENEVFHDCCADIEGKRGALELPVSNTTEDKPSALPGRYSGWLRTPAKMRP